jgi:carbamoyl-phosphate synthase/aspartate carbamoyltransferase
MTSQNHGYAVLVSEANGDNAAVKPLFQNINDGTNEGLYWPDRKWFSVRWRKLQSLQELFC